MKKTAAKPAAKSAKAAAANKTAANKKTALNKGYGFVVGGTAPLVGGTLKVQLGWNDYEDVKTGATEGNNIITGVGYEYPLSKRTFVYTAAGYTQVKTEKAVVETKTKTSEVMLGMVHKF